MKICGHEFKNLPKLSKMTECAVCLESKSKKSLQQVGDSVEHLIKKHVHESYNKELAAHSSHICSTCRRHLFNLDKGQE